MNTAEPHLDPAQHTPETLFREGTDWVTQETAKKSLQKFRQALRESKRTGDQRAMAWAQVQMAMVLQGQRHFDATLPILNDARSVFALLRDVLGLAISFHGMSLANRELGHNTVAHDYATQAIRLFQELGRTVELAWSYDNMAQIQLNLFNRAESLTFAKKAHAIFSEFGAVNGTAWSACRLGTIYLEMSFTDQAEASYTEAVGHFSKMKNKQGLASGYLGLAAVTKAQCRFDVAEDHLKKAKALFQELKLNDQLGWCLLHEAAIKRMLAKNEEALLLNKRAVQFFSPLKKHDGVAWALFQIAQILRDRGQLLKAWQTQREALVLHTDGSDRKGVAWSELELGEIFMGLNDVSHARECFVKVKVMADQLDDVPLKIVADKNIARLYLDEGLLQKAGGLLEEANLLAEKNHDYKACAEIAMEKIRAALLIDEVAKARGVLDGLDLLVETNHLYYLKPAVAVYAAQVLSAEGKAGAALTMLEEAMQWAEAYQYRAEHVLALLGIVELLIHTRAPDQLAMLLHQADKSIRLIGSRRLRAKFLLIKGLVGYYASGELDEKVFAQGVHILDESGLVVAQRQVFDVLTDFYLKTGLSQERAACARELRALLDRGPVDLHLIRSRRETLDSLPVSLIS